MSYGVEMWCEDTLRAGRLARGPRVVLQALYRRLITPRGTLRGGEDEAIYGLDLSGYVGAVGYPTAVLALPGLVEGELQKDERVADVDVDPSITTDSAGLTTITLNVRVTLHEVDEQFELVVGVSDVSTELIRMSVAA